MFELMTLAVVTLTTIGTLKLINKREGDKNQKEKYKQRFNVKYVFQNFGSFVYHGHIFMLIYLMRSVKILINFIKLIKSSTQKRHVAQCNHSRVVHLC